MRVATGSYTGDGSDGRSISGLPFQPNLVEIKAESAALAVMRFGTQVGDVSFNPTTTNGEVADKIQSITSDGFALGTHAEVNALGVVYHYKAYLASASDFEQGSYTGDGSDNRDMTIAAGFNADLLIIMGGANNAVFRTSSHTGDDCSLYAANNDIANAIQGFGTGTFNLGTSARVNANLTVYHYAVFKVGASCAVGTYTGDGTDNRDITTPWAPLAVTVKRDGGNAACLRTNTFTGDSSALYTATAAAANQIQGFGATSFRDGTSGAVNAAAGPYYWYAFRDAPVAAALQGALSATATVAAALTTSIALAGALSCPATVAGNLTTGINPKAAITATATVAGSLTTSIRLQAAVSAIATLQGTLTSLPGQPVLPSCVWAVPAQDLTFVVPPVPTYEVRG